MVCSNVARFSLMICVHYVVKSTCLHKSFLEIYETLVRWTYVWGVLITRNRQILLFDLFKIWREEVFYLWKSYISLLFEYIWFRYRLSWHVESTGSQRILEIKTFDGLVLRRLILFSYCMLLAFLMSSQSKSCCEHSTGVD